MHKKISILIILVLTLTMGLCFCSCDKQTGERYDLVSIHFSNVTLEMYEYNYILFDFHKNTYIIENKTKALRKKELLQYLVKMSNLQMMTYLLQIF